MDALRAPLLPLLLLLLAGVAAPGCAASGGHTPTARIAADPLFIPLHDGGKTDVRLGGAASDDALDDPAGSRPLRFHWDIDDPEARITSGALDATRLTVRFAGARPTAVRLTVTDDTGDSGAALVEIGITLDAPDLGPATD